MTNALHIYYAISMEETTTEAVRRALADGLQTILSIPAEPRDIRLPSRIAAAATPLAIAHGADAAAWAVLLNAERSRFPALYGAPLVSYATAENGWLKVVYQGGDAWISGKYGRRMENVGKDS